MVLAFSAIFFTAGPYLRLIARNASIFCKAKPRKMPSSAVILLYYCCESPLPLLCDESPELDEEPLEEVDEDCPLELDEDCPELLPLDEELLSDDEELPPVEDELLELLPELL